MTQLDSKLELQRFQPKNANEVAELLRQRTICGWDTDKVDEAQHGTLDLILIRCDRLLNGQKSSRQATK